MIGNGHDSRDHKVHIEEILARVAQQQERNTSDITELKNTANALLEIVTSVQSRCVKTWLNQMLKVFKHLAVVSLNSEVRRLNSEIQ